jgi:hypothetical protein
MGPGGVKTRHWWSGEIPGISGSEYVTETDVHSYSYSATLSTSEESTTYEYKSSEPMQKPQ